MILVDALLGIAAALLLAPVTVLALQVVMALPAYRARPMPRGRRPTIAVLVPAHDEGAGIADTLRAIAAQLAPADRLLVVADNCSDDTAAIAAAAGAEVVERRDPERRGKGFALAFGLSHLNRKPGSEPVPEVLIIIDADCRVAPGTIERLARTAAAAGRPVQALYEMCSGAGGGLAEFAWRVKNHVRPLGYLRLGLPCQLMGTGMAIPWALVDPGLLANGHLVEDMALGLELARRGAPPLFCPEARVTSVFPASAAAAAQQRTRWEHGHLGLILRAPRFVRADVKVIALLLDLCVPPLALLFLLLAGLLALSWVFLFHLALLGAAVLLAWAAYGRDVLPLAKLACAPLYAAAKLPLYVRFVLKRQVEWVRTRRGE